MDAYRRGDRFLVHLDLPGVDPGSIELTCDQNVLTVQAERRLETSEEDQVVVNERPQGSFSRQLFVSERLQANQPAGSWQTPRRSDRRPARRVCAAASPNVSAG
jgi:HSP20 family protein